MVFHLLYDTLNSFKVQCQSASIITFLSFLVPLHMSNHIYHYQHLSPSQHFSATSQNYPDTTPPSGTTSPLLKITLQPLNHLPPIPCNLTTSQDHPATSPSFTASLPPYKLPPCQLTTFLQPHHLLVTSPPLTSLPPHRLQVSLARVAKQCAKKGIPRRQITPPIDSSARRVSTVYAFKMTLEAHL